MSCHIYIYIYIYIYIFIHKFGYIYPTILSCYSSISVPYGDWEGQWFECSVSWLQVCLSVEGAKNVFWIWLSPFRGWSSLIMTFLGKFGYSSLFYLVTAQSQCLMGIGRDRGLSTLCHSCGFSCQQRVLKTFPGPGFLRSEDGIV